MKMNIDRLLRKANRFAQRNIIVILICLNSILILCISNTQAGIAASEQITTGIMGYTDTKTGIYRSLSGEDIMDAGQQFMVNDRYNAVLQTAGLRNVTGAQLVGGLSYTYELPNGTKMTYQWYEKTYRFEVIAYTNAIGGQLAHLVPQPTPTEQLFYKYDFSGVWWNFINDYTQILNFPSDQQRGTLKYSGYLMQENQAQLSSLNQMAITARVGVVLGDTVQPVGLIREAGWQGEYKLQGTSYYLTDFNTIKPGADGSCTSTGYIAKEYVENPFGLPEKDASKDIENKSREFLKQGGSAQDAKGLVSEQTLLNSGQSVVKLAGSAIDIQIGQGLHEVPLDPWTSGAYFQTLQTVNKPLVMHDLDTDASIVRNYVPDTAILPNPNIQCYFNLPIQMSPEVRATQCQMAYTYIEHGIKDCAMFPWIPIGLKMLHNVRKEVLDPTVYTKSVEAFNVYYIQTVQFKINFASIYQWQPDPENNEPGQPDINFEHPPDEFNVTTGGDTTIIIHDEFPPVLNWLQPLLWAVAIIAAVALVLFIKAQFALRNPQKLLMNLNKVMGNFGIPQGVPQAPQPNAQQNPASQQQNPQPVQNPRNPQNPQSFAVERSVDTYAVIVNGSSRWVPYLVMGLCVTAFVLGLFFGNQLFHFF